MAGLRLKTGPLLPNLAFCFLRREETLSGSGCLSLFPEVGSKGMSFFKKISLWCPFGPLLHLNRVCIHEELSEGRVGQKVRDGL